jgi:hypothetical protein
LNYPRFFCGLGLLASLVFGEEAAGLTPSDASLLFFIFGASFDCSSNLKASFAFFDNFFFGFVILSF